MKNIINLLGIVILLFTLQACDKSDNTTNPPLGKNYFPNGDGTYYKYAIEKTDSAGSNSFGNRFTWYIGTSNKGGTVYQVQYDTIDIASQKFGNTSYFRKTDTGVFYFLDTLGLADAVPDSLRQFISLDSEVRLFLLPLTAGNSWPVFKLTLNYFGINFVPIEVNAKYEADEDITLNLASGTVTKKAAKIRYTLKIITELFSPAKTYETYLWVVENIGIAKWEGNAAVLNALAGSGIDFDDSTSTVSQSLVDYIIK
ncbi:MAG: hypothetical protein HXY49_05640 [Ignavibacteriaceae bacterium]|nr:hypothetical protein [Ignavibacteriaceae bacterium]